MPQSILNQLYQTQKTVFRVGELAQLFPDRDQQSLLSSLAYYVDRQKLRRPRRGIYAKLEFNPQELANKIYVPSYISLQTALLEHGLIFQFSSVISSASYLSRELEVEGRKLAYHKFQPEILASPAGIIKQNQINLASAERAFLDTIYLWGEFHFDNLRPLDWEKVGKLMPLYGQKVMVERVKKQKVAESKRWQ